MAAPKGKSGWILIVLLLAGLVIGGLLGQLASKVDFLWWLGYSQTFGLTTPLYLDLSVIQLTFGISFQISVSSIIYIIPCTGFSLFGNQPIIPQSIFQPSRVNA